MVDDIVRHRGGEHRVEQCRSQRTTDLLGGVDQGAGHTRVMGLDTDERKTRHRYHHEAKAEAHEQLTGQDVADIAGVETDLSQREQTDRREHGSNDHRDLGPGTRHELAGEYG